MEGPWRQEGALQSSSEHHGHLRGSGPRVLKGHLPGWKGTSSDLLSANNVQELHQSLYILSFCLINSGQEELNNVFVYAVWLKKV